MATLIFDIETVGEEWAELNEVTQATLLRFAERVAKTEEERVLYQKDCMDGLGFSPLTGFVVAVGVYDTERQQGAVYYTGTGREPDEQVDDFVYKQRSERALLEDFFEGARSYDTLVSFNGRSFDLPFLLHRAAIHGVPSMPELMEERYLTRQRTIRHVDLQEQLTFYGAMSRRPPLHMFCRAYGIESPKEGGITGDDVAKLFQQKKFREIADYNAADVRATAKLYDIWLKHLAPPSFLNTVAF